MKKIFGLALAALLVIGLVGGGTLAYFSDTETTTNNVFTAGTLDLELVGGTDSVDSVTATWTESNFKPGDTGGANGALTINNLGSVPGYLKITNVTHTVVAGTGEARGTSDKSLEDFLKVWIFFDVDGNGTLDAADQNIYGTSGAYLAIGSMGASFTPNPDITLAAVNGGTTDTTHVTIKYVWTSTAEDNEAQGDVLTFGFTVEIQQDDPTP